MALTFDKDLVCFDTETTGLNVLTDKIIQIAAIKLDKDTFKVKDKLNLYIQPEGNYQISIAAYTKHGITPDFLKDKPYLKDVAQQIVDFFDNCDILGFNEKRFDIVITNNRLKSLGYDLDFMNRKIYDSCCIEQRINANTLEATFQRYYGKTMEEFGLTAHDAFSDVKATIGVFKAQLKRGVVEPEQMFGLSNAIDLMNFDNKLQPCFSVGKYYHLSLEFVASFDQQYLQWCVSDKCTFDKYTKDFIRQYIK